MIDPSATVYLSKSIYRILMICSTVLPAVTILLGYQLLKTSSENYNNNQSLRAGNEEIYKEITNATNLMFDNTDIMMRFAHYQNNHDPEVEALLCPECTSRWPPKRDQPNETNLPIDETEYLATDAISDTQEVCTAIRRLAFSLIQQQHRLRFTLMKMRFGDQTPDKVEVPEFEKDIQHKDGSGGLSDFTDAIEANIRPELHSKLAPLVAAVRYAENGGSGREYGILHPSVKPTYRSQAGWCAATVQKNWDRYEKQGGDTENFDQYIAFLGKKYCPTGDPNDTMGLNKNWIKNVSSFYKEFQ